MKTAPEVLQELEAARVRSAEEEKKWTRLKPLYPRLSAGSIGIFMVCYALITLFFTIARHPSNPSTWHPDYVLGLVLISFILIRWQKRHQGLLALIQKEAPEFYQKLKDKGVA